MPNSASGVGTKEDGRKPHGALFVSSFGAPNRIVVFLVILCHTEKRIKPGRVRTLYSHHLIRAATKRRLLLFPST